MTFISFPNLIMWFSDVNSVDDIVMSGPPTADVIPRTPSLGEACQSWSQRQSLKMAREGLGRCLQAWIPKFDPQKPPIFFFLNNNKRLLHSCDPSVGGAETSRSVGLTRQPD